MYDIILTTCPPWDPYNPSPSLGYLAAYLKKYGYRPFVHELNTFLFNNASDDDKYLWLFDNSHYWNNPDYFPTIYNKLSNDIDAFVDEILCLDVDVCGISVAYTKELITIELIKKIKSLRPDMKIILGGPGSSCDGSRKIYVECIPHLVDVFIIGEGEETLLQVMNSFKNSLPLKDIPGALIHKDDQKYHFKPRPPIPDLNKIPFPTYEEFRLDGGLHSIIPVFSRGCVGNCVFCNVRSIWGKYRIRSPENIFNEIKYFVQRKKITKYQIFDSAINGDLKKLSQLCDLIINAEYDLDWTALAIPRRAMSPDLFVKMKKAGCNRLEIGVESGSNKILSMMNKRYTAQDAERFIREAHQAGITVVIFLIVGFPGEKEEEFNETVDFLRRNKDYIDVISSINTFMVLEGTPILRQARKYGIILPDERWDLYWYTAYGNDYDYRKEKLKKLTDVAHELDMTFVKDNLID